MVVVHTLHDRYRRRAPTIPAQREKVSWMVQPQCAIFVSDLDRFRLNGVQNGYILVQQLLIGHRWSLCPSTPHQIHIA